MENLLSPGLIKYVDAVLVFFDEALETANLTFNSPKSFLDGGLFIDVAGQGHAAPFVFDQYTPSWYTLNTEDCRGRLRRVSRFVDPSGARSGELSLGRTLERWRRFQSKP